MTIKFIIGALVSMIQKWTPNMTLQQDIEMGLADLAGAALQSKGQTLANTLIADAVKVEATYNNIVNNQAGLLANVDVAGNRVLVLAVREDAPLAKQLLGV